MNIYINFLLKIIPRGMSSINRRYSSVLYIPGDKAHQTVSVLTPHLDFDNQFQDIPKLEKNIALRGMNLNVDTLYQHWKLLKEVEGNKVLLEKHRLEIAEKMKGLKKIGNVNDMEKYKVQGKLVREDLKLVMKTLWNMEENIIVKALKLPNELHPDTPNETEKVVHNFRKRPDDAIKIENHVEIGRKANLLHYVNSSFYFLEGNAALYELGALYFFTEELQKCEFVQFCNTDFARSIVVEGCGIDHTDPECVFIVEDALDGSQGHNRQHLVGGASLVSFSALLAKHVLPASALPLRYFAKGCQYNPNKNVQDRGLFSVWQSSAIELLIATSDDFGNMMVEFNNALSMIIHVYEQLGYHFRVVYVPANKLKPWESLRASIQMYSVHYQSYIEVGHLSTCDTYISKRLLMYYGPEHEKQENKFIRIVSGTVLLTPKLLGCVLEYDGVNNNYLTIPNPLRKHIFGAGCVY